MVPGLLNTTIDIHPITRISPSTYYSLKKCNLREILSKGNQKALLPVSPAARLGTAIHMLFEQAGKGLLQSMNEQEVEKKIREIIIDIENEMKQSWINMVLVPLNQHFSSFEVRLLKSVKFAYSIANSQKFASTYDDFSKEKEDFELWVETKDGLIGGYIDKVHQQANKITLIDYKTGHTVISDENSNEITIKPEYEYQMKIYAALYASTYDKWPNALQLISLMDKSLIIPFKRKDCEILIIEAKNLLNEINNSILSKNADRKGLISNLANPHGGTCKYCLYRPACPSYMCRLPISRGKGFWLDDFWGKVIEKMQQGNGLYSLTLEVKEGNVKLLRIRGLNGFAERHPALQIIETGDWIAAFNLKRSMSPEMFTESSMTTLYKMPDGGI